MMEGFQLGVIVMGFAVATLFFARFWRRTGDRLFGFFALSFGSLAVNHAAFLFIPERTEGRTLLYLVRLLAFVVLLVGIIDKNRARR